jgi:uncharacterized surface anchored protein
MKYKVKQTDLFLKGKVVPEGSIIDSKNYSEEDLESLKHLLEEVEKTSNIAVTLDPEETGKESVATESKTKRPRKPKS